MNTPGYHVTEIAKGSLGESSKILEEVHELIDAEQQGIRIMQICELADIVGAVEMYRKAHFPDIDFSDLIAMAEVTARAFRNGRR